MNSEPTLPIPPSEMRATEIVGDNIAFLEKVSGYMDRVARCLQNVDVTRQEEGGNPLDWGNWRVHTFLVRMEKYFFQNQSGGKSDNKEFGTQIRSEWLYRMFRSELTKHGVENNLTPFVHTDLLGWSHLHAECVLEYPEIVDIIRSHAGNWLGASDRLYPGLIAQSIWHDFFTRIVKRIVVDYTTQIANFECIQQDLGQLDRNSVGHDLSRMRDQIMSTRDFWRSINFVEEFDPEIWRGILYTITHDEYASSFRSSCSSILEYTLVGILMYLMDGDIRFWQGKSPKTPEEIESEKQQIEWWEGVRAHPGFQAAMDGFVAAIRGGEHDGITPDEETAIEEQRIIAEKEAKGEEQFITNEFEAKKGKKWSEFTFDSGMLEIFEETIPKELNEIRDRVLTIGNRGKMGEYRLELMTRMEREFPHCIEEGLESIMKDISKIGVLIALHFTNTLARQICWEHNHIINFDNYSPPSRGENMAQSAGVFFYLIQSLRDGKRMALENGRQRSAQTIEDAGLVFDISFRDDIKTHSDYLSQVTDDVMVAIFSLGIGNWMLAVLDRYDRGEIQLESATRSQKLVLEAFLIN